MGIGREPSLPCVSAGRGVSKLLQWGTLKVGACRRACLRERKQSQNTEEAAKDTIYNEEFGGQLFEGRLPL